MWHHEACEGAVNVSFIANTFEKFIGMIHEYRGCFFGFYLTQSEEDHGFHPWMN